MDVSKWLNNIQELYNSLCDLDTNYMTDWEFFLALLDLMPSDTGWQHFLSTLCTTIHDADQMGVEINSMSFVTRIHEEHWHHHKDDHRNNSHIFSTQLDAQHHSNSQNDHVNCLWLMPRLLCLPSIHNLLSPRTSINSVPMTTVVLLIVITPVTASFTKEQRRDNIEKGGVALGTSTFHH